MRRPLLMVVESEATDAEAVARMRPIVRSEARAARRVLALVELIRDREGGYVPDRAYRVLAAAMGEGNPEPIRSDLAEAYEREKRLGLLPLQDAFGELSDLVPKLREIGERASELGRGEDRGAAQAAFHRMWADAGKLVGPRSSHTDPLIRSSVARMVAVRYLRAVAGLSHGVDPAQPMWGPANRGARF